MRACIDGTVNNWILACRGMTETQGCASVLSACTNITLGLYLKYFHGPRACLVRGFQRPDLARMASQSLFIPAAKLASAVDLLAAAQFRGTTGHCMLSPPCLLGATARLLWISTLLCLLITVKAQFWRHSPNWKHGWETKHSNIVPWRDSKQRETQEFVHPSAPSCSASDPCCYPCSCEPENGVQGHLSQQPGDSSCITPLSQASSWSAARMVQLNPGCKC